MGKNKARHILHGVLDCLPIILIPIFMIYSQNHEINDNTLQVQENLQVNFNQIADVNGNVETSTQHTGIRGFSNYNMLANHTYYICFEITEQLNSTSIYLANISQSYQYVSMKNNIINNTNPQFCRFNYTTSNDTDYRYIGIVNTTNDVMKTNNYIMVDLTKMFGYGNEPTAQVFSTYYDQPYYDFTLSHIEYIEDYIETYNDTDIMSQSFYCLYNAVDKYFNMGNVFGMKNLYTWFEVNIFGGTASPSIYIVWNIVLYEFIMDLLFLLYGLFMFFIDLCKRLMEKPLNSIK